MSGRIIATSQSAVAGDRTTESPIYIDRSIIQQRRRDERIGLLSLLRNLPHHAGMHPNAGAAITTDAESAELLRRMARVQGLAQERQTPTQTWANYPRKSP